MDDLAYMSDGLLNQTHLPIRHQSLPSQNQGQAHHNQQKEKPLSYYISQPKEHGDEEGFLEFDEQDEMRG